MRPSLQALMKKIKGKNVFIIGGGPSAKNVDFSLLHDEVVICINDAYRYFPNAVATYWVDETWAAENAHLLVNHNGLKFTSKPKQHISYDRDGDPKTICDGAILLRTGDYYHR